MNITTSITIPVTGTLTPNRNWTSRTTSERDRSSSLAMTSPPPSPGRTRELRSPEGRRSLLEGSCSGRGATLPPPEYLQIHKPRRPRRTTGPRLGQSGLSCCLLVRNRHPGAPYLPAHWPPGRSLYTASAYSPPTCACPSVVGFLGADSSHSKPS